VRARARARARARRFRARPAARARRRLPAVRARATIAPLCSGVRADLAARLPLWPSDWTVLDARVPSATLFVFFAQAVPALTFSAYLSERTGNALGAVETLLGMGLCGLLFAAAAGQPLVLVGTTGPVCVFLATLFDAARALGLPFRGALFWTSAWAALMHAALAAAGAPRALVARLTGFSRDAFGALVGALYVAEGAGALARLAAAAPAAGGARALTVGLGLGVWAAAALATGARAWPCAARLPRAAVAALADYGMPAVVVIFALLPLAAAPAAREGLALLAVPAERAGADARGAGAALPGWAVAAAAAPAAVLTALLFFDHQVSAALAQEARFRLRKPPAYDWDFLLLGGALLLTGALALPPVYGLLPQAPLHVRALARVEPRAGAPGGERWAGVCETRASALGQAALLLALLAPPLRALLAGVPTAVLYGVLIFLGLEGLRGNGAVARAAGVAAGACGRGGGAPLAAAQRALCAAQLASVGALFALTQTPAAMAFPVGVVALVPLRLALLPRLVDAAALEAADPRAGAEEGALEGAAPEAPEAAEAPKEGEGGADGAS